MPPQDIQRIPNGKAYHFSVQGESYESFQQNLSAKVGLSTNFLLFSGSVETSFSKRELSISQTGFVSVKFFMRYDTCKLQARSQKYMYPEVINDFKTKSGRELIERYGAAVLMGMDVGGHWSDCFSVSKLYENSTSSVDVAVSAGYANYVKGEASTSISDAIEREKSIVERKVNVVGGDPKYAPSEIDKWKESVKENPAFMDFTPDGLVAIWDLFPEHAVKLLEGFEEICTQKRKLKIFGKNVVECSIVEGLRFASDAGSHAHRDLDLYKPQSSSDKYVGVNGNSNKILVIKEVSDKYGAACKPDGWHKVWSNYRGKSPRDYTCWLPKAPPGFVALGIYCKFGADNADPPTEEETRGMVVVSEQLVEKSNVKDNDEWSDAGTGAKYDLRLGRLHHEALWPVYTDDPVAGQLPSVYTIKSEYMAR